MTTEGKVEEAYVIVGLVLGPIYLQGMCMCDFLALHEQVGAQCDSILGAQCEVLVNQSILCWNIHVCANLGSFRAIPTVARVNDGPVREPGGKAEGYMR